MRLRERVHAIVSPAEHGDHLSRLFDFLIIGLIFGDITCFILATVPEYRGDGEGFYRWFQYVVLTVFLVEYAARLWSCVEDPRFAGFGGRVRYARTPMALIDLVAVLPVMAFVPGLSIPTELTSVRIFRVMRLGKLVRYFESVQILGRSIWRLRSELGTLIIGVSMVVLVSSLLVFRFEHEANPEQFGSVPEAMWWSIVTMSTVGYGDLAPVTAAGRVLASVIMVCGIAMFAVPAGLLGAAFTEEVNIQHERRKRQRERRLRKAEHLREQDKEEAPVTTATAVTCPDCGRRFQPHPPPTP